MLVIVIIGLITSVCGVALPSLLKEEQFEKSVAEVKNKLMLAQEVMIDYDTDVTVIFRKEAKGVSCHLYPAKKVPDNLFKTLNRNTLLKGIENVGWTAGIENILTLNFSATDGKMATGGLLLQGKKEVTLHLKGYVAPIQKKDEKYEEKKPITAYPQEFLSVA
jgi:hypothetical protein